MAKSFKQIATDGKAASFCKFYKLDVPKILAYVEFSAPETEADPWAPDNEEAVLEAFIFLDTQKQFKTTKGVNLQRYFASDAVSDYLIYAALRKPPSATVHLNNVYLNRSDFFSDRQEKPCARFEDCIFIFCAHKIYFKNMLRPRSEARARPTQPSQRGRRHFPPCASFVVTPQQAVKTYTQ